MAETSLTDFFDSCYCDNWTMRKAVVHCAMRAGNLWKRDLGLPRGLILKAAYAWHPENHMYQTFKQILIADDPSSFSVGRGVFRQNRNNKSWITPSVTRVRKSLETFIRQHYFLYRPIPKPVVKKLKLVMPLLQLFNDYDDRVMIKYAIWRLAAPGCDVGSMQSLMYFAKHLIPATPWEHEMQNLILTADSTNRPSKPSGDEVYKLIRKLKTRLRYDSGKPW